MATPHEHMQAALEAIIAEGRDHTPDPIERAKWFEAALNDLQVMVGELAAARRAAVHEARQRMSAVAVAEALGVTRARVYQILDGR